MKTPLLVLIFMIVGCQSQQQSALGPTGPARPAKTWKTPSDVPFIDLTVDNQFSKWTSTPTIIDTNSFTNQRQLTSHSEGPHYRPAKFLPPHKKPQVEEEGPPNNLRAGMGNSTTIMHSEGGFETIVQTPWTPPDPSLAVGPNHVLVTVNMAIAWYTKDGNEQFSARLDSSGSPGFFEEIGAGDFTFDPKCFYDIHSQRFVVLALEKYDTEAWITMAVSDDDDPNGVWYKYRTWSVIDINGSGYWVDYPGFGFDNGYFYVTGNLYGLTSGWGGVLYRIFDKTPMLSGEPVEITDIRKGAHASMQGSQQYGDSTTAFFVGRRNSTQLRIASILTPSSPSVTSSIVNVPSNSGPGGVSNPGGSLNPLDGRMMNSQLRDNSLFASHGIAGSGVTAESRWYEFDVTNFPNSGPTLIQSGNVEMPNSLSSFYPAIAPNKRGEVAVVMGAANSTTIPELYIAGRRISDETGQMGELLLVATGTHGVDGRWGDYFDMTVDPNNEIVFWYIGQYKTGNGWQTYVGSALISCVEDVNVDGFVNVNDLLLLIGNWGDDGEGAEIALPYDTVEVNDILALIAKFGTCP